MTIYSPIESVCWLEKRPQGEGRRGPYLSKGRYATQEFHGMIGKTNSTPSTPAHGGQAQSPAQYEWMAADDTTPTPAHDHPRLSAEYEGMVANRTTTDPWQRPRRRHRHGTPVFLRSVSRSERDWNGQLCAKKGHSPDTLDQKA